MLTFAGALYGWTIPAVPLVLEILFAFFVPSVALSRLGAARKRELVDVAKGGPRDAWQVFANGGVATACAVAAAAIGGEAGSGRIAFALLWAYAGSYAAATADTWSTEIGSAFGGTPRSIVTWRPLARGLSGGVSPLGSLAMLAGAAWIAAVWALPQRDARAFWIVAAAGAGGALADSLLGATLQAMRWCPRCERASETRLHACGTPTVHRRGLPWMTNDAVNFLATACGAALAALLFVAFV